MLGKTLSSRYHIVKHLGGGGFGQTYLAEDRQLPGKPLCVVKRLKPKATDSLNLEARRLFDREAQVLYKLGSHPQIPLLLAHFEEEQEFYLVQEFIEGHELKQELPPVGTYLSEAQVIAILQDLLKILEFVHQQDVIHRDIKPSNLIRREQDGKIVLIDFGAVKQLSSQTIHSEGQTSLTIIGSPGYMPNEQISGKPRFSSDIYAVGMIGIQALTGLSPSQLPEDPKTSEIIWRDRLSADVTPTSTLLRDVLDKMVRYDYRQRYQTATEALQVVSLLDNPHQSLQGDHVFLPQLTQPKTFAQSSLTASLSCQTLESHKQIVPDSTTEQLVHLVDSQEKDTRVSPFPTKYLLPMIIAAALAASLAVTSEILYFQKPKSLWEQAQKISLVNTLSGSTHGIKTIALSPDGQLLANSLASDKIESTNKESQTFASGNLDNKNKESQTFASGNLDNTIKDDQTFASGNLDNTIKESQTFASGNLDNTNKESQTFASGNLDNTIKIRNLRTNDLTQTLIGHSGNINSIAISSDGHTLVSGSADQTIKVWNLQTGEVIRTITGHTGAVDAVAISPDGQTIVSGSADKTIRIWNLQTGQVIHSLIGTTRSLAVSAVAISPDGQRFATNDSYDVKVWDMVTGELLRTLEGHKRPITSIAISSNNENLVSGSLDGTAKLWNLTTGELVNTFVHGSPLPNGAPSEMVYSVAISPDGQTLATGSGMEENTIKLWKLRTGEGVRTLTGHSDTVFSLAISPDGQTVYSGSFDGTVKVWQVQ